jgi:hypothetical protein
VVIRTTIERANLLAEDAHRILSGVESAKSRIITLDDSYKALSALSVKQDDLFRQALRCVEVELYRPAHVMAWAAFVDFLHDRLAQDGFQALSQVRPAWNVKAKEDLREQADYQVIEAAGKCGVYGKTMMKALHGLLNRRNECAHPEDYYPDLNETLGYVAELFKRVKALQKKTP